MSRTARSPARPGPVPGLRGFAAAWARALDGTSYVPMSRAEIEQCLYGFAGRLATALRADLVCPRTGYEIGTELVEADFVAPEALSHTIEVIDTQFLATLGRDDADARARLARLVGGLAAGHARALRDRTLDEQQAIYRAALIARTEAEGALRASEARFRHQALHDPLTGLPNRALLAERLDAVFAHPSPGRRVGLCFVDIDRFKAVNDTLGHHVGDRLLTAVADRLARYAAESGHLVAHMGGDEFVLLVADPTCADDVVKVADRVLATFAEPVSVSGHRLPVSASAGVVERPVAGTDAAEVMRAADIALHWAKADGKGRWMVFDVDRGTRQVARYTLSAAMPAALDRDEFILYYQPLVGLADGRLEGVEALARWRHPTLGLVGPDRFIGLAEETGLIVPLGHRMLELACRQAADWRRVSPDAPFVSVNLAARQIRHPGLVSDVAGVLDSTGLPPRLLQLEITESAVIGTDDDTIGSLRALADLGIRIAIDDFGTGYSNLAYLSTLPVHTLKLASRFARPLRSPATSKAADNAIVASLVALGHTLGLNVTAEGVETAAQAERLHAIGCDTGQGWYLGRPQPPTHIDPSAHRPPTVTHRSGPPSRTC